MTRSILIYWIKSQLLYAKMSIYIDEGSSVWIQSLEHFKFVCCFALYCFLYVASCSCDCDLTLAGHALFIYILFVNLSRIVNLSSECAQPDLFHQIQITLKWLRFEIVSAIASERLLGMH